MQPRRLYVRSSLYVVDAIRAKLVEKEESCIFCGHEFDGKEFLEPNMPRLPVMTICGHIFCHACIMKWLLPDAIYEPHITMAKIPPFAFATPNSLTAHSDIAVTYVGGIKYIFGDAPKIPTISECIEGQREREREKAKKQQALLLQTFIAEDPRDLPDPTNRDQCPMCRQRLIPDRYKLVKMDANVVFGILPMMINFFYKKRLRKIDFLAVRIPEVVEGAVTIALLTMHDRLFHRSEVEKEVLNSTFDQLEDIDWWLWGLPKINTVERLATYKLSVKLFVRFLVNQVIGSLHMLRVVSEQPST